jgi:plastocyanin
MRNVNKTCRQWPIAAAMSGVLLVTVGCGDGGLTGPVANAETAKSIRDSLKSASGGTGESGTTAAVGTGWATLRGKFTFDGTPPARQPYNVTKDFEICTVNGQPPQQEKLVVQSGSNGILNVAIYLRRASRVHESLTQNLQPVVFDQKVCVFLPHVIAAQVGKPVTLKNSDPTGHNMSFEATRFNEMLAGGSNREYVARAESATPEKVTCSVHPWMEAFFLSRANPYVALTKEDGSFELANLPAGEELEFQVWHESATGAGGGLGVGATAETKALGWSNRGRFKVKLNQDEVKELQISVPASSFKAI